MSDLSGSWEIDLQFVRGRARHTVVLEQDGADLSGQYRSQFGEQALRGKVQGDQVEMHVGISYQHVGAHYAFRGQVDGGRMAGQVDLGEYWSGTWAARRSG